MLCVEADFLSTFYFLLGGQLHCHIDKNNTYAFYVDYNKGNPNQKTSVLLPLDIKNVKTVVWIYLPKQEDQENKKIIMKKSTNVNINRLGVSLH